ncbi:MAG: hypothetical protein LH645_12940 [Actinomycetia bacterium]|nr:hypothetical protein [Actinomycetes bacterium]
MFKEVVGDFVCDIACNAPRCSQRVADDNDAAANLEGRGRERECLQSLKFFDPTSVDELFRTNELDADVCR